MFRTFHSLPIALAAVLAALPAGAQTVVFSANATIADTDLTYEGRDIVVQGCTLTVNGVHSFNSLTVQRSAANQPGILTHAPAFSNAQVAGFHLIIAQTVLIEGASGALVASRIDTDGRGFASSVGPGLGPAAGTGVCCGRGGSGHGGAGGAGVSYQGGPAYDTDAIPAQFGSGGTPRFTGSNAGAGGGAVRLTVGGTMTLSGTITASAAGCAGDNGAAAGGTVRIRAPLLVGTGGISVRGGTNTSGPTGGGGAGGRVALNTCALQISLAAVNVLGGTGFQSGAPGTVFLGSASGLISQPPAGQVLLDGGTAQFSVVATGTGSLTYQWRRNGAIVENTGRISGAAATTLTVTGLRTTDAGMYDVVLRDDCGPFVSDPALLDVFCRADYDRNRSVEPADVSFYVQTWYDGILHGTLTGDFNADGQVDPADVAFFIQVWYGAVVGGC